MTIKELCKEHSVCDECPYLPICGDIPEKYESGDDLEATNAIIETAKALDQARRAFEYNRAVSGDNFDTEPMYEHGKQVFGSGWKK